MAIDPELDELEQKKPERQRRFKWWHYWGAAGILCFGGVLGFYVYCIWSGRASLNRELAAAKKAGMPLTVRDVFAIVEAIDDQNAAPLLLPVIQSLDATKKERDKTVGPSAGVPLLRSEVKELLRKEEPLLLEALEALKRPGLDWDYDFTKGYVDGYEELDSCKDLGRLLILSGRDKVEAGDYDEGFRRMEAALDIGSRIARIPMSLPMLVRLALESETLRATENLLLAFGDNPEVLRAADAFLRKKLPRVDLRRIVAGELCTLREMLHMYGDNAERRKQIGLLDRSPTLEERWMDMTMFSPFYRDGFEARMVLFCKTAYISMPEDDTDFKGIEKAFDNMDRLRYAESWVYRLASQVMTPVYPGITDTLKRTHAQRSVALCGVKMLKERVQTGKLPSSLPNLGSDSLDIYTGKPLLITKKGSKVVIYSVGADHTDDKGERRGDIPFEIK